MLDMQIETRKSMEKLKTDTYSFLSGPLASVGE